MKLLFSSKMEEVDVVRAMLADEGLSCEVTNDTVPLPGAEFYPQLWVEDADFARANAVVAAFRKVPTPKLAPWICPSCGEPLEEQFTTCWKCGATRKDTGA